MGATKTMVQGMVLVKSVVLKYFMIEITIKRIVNPHAYK